MPIELCLFDLDDTLLRTEHLVAFRGRGNVQDATPDFTRRLGSAYNGSAQGQDAHLYSSAQLKALRKLLPAMRWGVFTQSPRRYAIGLLELAYPDIDWAVIVAFEDVDEHKPQGNGVWKAMGEVGVSSTSAVAYIGDSRGDVSTAYSAGCWSFIDRQGWPKAPEDRHWQAVKMLPDAIFKGVDELAELLVAPHLRLPELDYWSETHEAGERSRGRRIPAVSFLVGEGRAIFPVDVMGRMFSAYQEIEPRRSWHHLTRQMLDFKENGAFPDLWVSAIDDYIKRETADGGKYVVTVIPRKPRRPGRLERLLEVVATAWKPSHFNKFLPGEVIFLEDVLSFNEGVGSSHGQHLNREQRFAQAKDYLVVKRPQAVEGKKVLIFDDVITTGSQLYWAACYLREAGASEVRCMSLTIAIGKQ